MQYRFKLLPGVAANLQLCPQCGKKRLSPFLDTATNTVLDGFGRCNREQSCGYFRIPEGAGDYTPTTPIPPAPRRDRVQSVFLEVGATLDAFDKPELVTDWIRKRFGKDTLARVFPWYWPNAYNKDGRTWTIHWHLDEHGRLHTGKLMEYERRKNAFGLAVLKRSKRPGSINWYHKVDAPFTMEGQQYTFGEGANDLMWTQTLYGLTQLKHRPNDTVCIVEGYKTAIVAAIYLPRYVWLGADSVGMLSAYDKERLPILQPLKGRRVYLMPDFDALDKWNDVARLGRAAGYDIQVHPDIVKYEAIAQKMGVECRDLEDLLLLFDTDIWKHI